MQAVNLKRFQIQSRIVDDMCRPLNMSLFILFLYAPHFVDGLEDWRRLDPYGRLFLPLKAHLQFAVL